MTTTEIDMGEHPNTKQRPKITKEPLAYTVTMNPTKASTATKYLTSRRGRRFSNTRSYVTTALEATTTYQAVEAKAAPAVINAITYPFVRKKRQQLPTQRLTAKPASLYMVKENQETIHPALVAQRQGQKFLIGHWSWKLIRIINLHQPRQCETCLLENQITGDDDHNSQTEVPSLQGYNSIH